MPVTAEPTTIVTMPQMGVSVAEGTLVEWLVAAGDHVTSDQSVCVISTDKIDTEVPAPASGTIAEILVPAGQTVAVGTPLASIVAQEAGGGADADIDARPVRTYSPVVRRIADAHDVDLELVEGTGRNGRVSKRDLLAHVEARRSTPVPVPSAAVGSLDAAPPVAASAHRAELGAARPLSWMRLAIAEHMTRSLATAAHCHTFIEADMSRVEARRAALGFSPLPIVARAAVDALRSRPSLNAWLEGDNLALHTGVHLGIAVSLGDEGLIVPVVHNAHELSVEGLASRIRELARRARAHELTSSDVRGATFTITNLGAYGTLMSTPIINQPEVAILDLQAIVKRPVVVDDAIAIRPMAVLGLGWDHRALDGALAAQFLATLRDNLEQFD
jgi:pyruvate/2-oxoglutarate dehydrogenase complex dihydrolipoamide acyltransferase (E2) component